MKIVIQGYWNARVRSSGSVDLSMAAEDVIKSHGHITVCSVTVDGRYLGDVNYDGQKLTIETTLVKRRDDL